MQSVEVNWELLNPDDGSVYRAGRSDGWGSALEDARRASAGWLSEKTNKQTAGGGAALVLDSYGADERVYHISYPDLWSPWRMETRVSLNPDTADNTAARSGGAAGRPGR